MYKILVVDRDAKTREGYRSGLVSAGFTVCTATTRAEALKLVTEWKPDLAVLDVRLGEESGLDLLRQVLDVRQSLTTILVSESPGYRDDFVSWLADAFIDKTPDPSSLTSKVRELLVPAA
jgi:DNA-binding response OmpR family regulator